MKISSWLKPPEFVPQGAQLHPSFHFLPPSQIVNPIRRIQSDGAGAKKANMNTVKGEIQNFSYVAPNALSVQLVGDFTNWQEWPINLRKGPNGVWRAAIRLWRGTYYYRFLVDGQWRDDPECPLYVPNPFGCQNAVRQVN